MLLLEEIDLLKKRISSYHSYLAAIRTDAVNHEFTDRALASHAESIEWHKSRMAELIHRRDNAPDIIEVAQKQLRAAKGRLNTLTHQRDIERLKVIAEQLRELAEEESE